MKPDGVPRRPPRQPPSRPATTPQASSGRGGTLILRRYPRRLSMASDLTSLRCQSRQPAPESPPSRARSCTLDAMGPLAFLLICARCTLAAALFTIQIDVVNIVNTCPAAVPPVRTREPTRRSGHARDQRPVRPVASGDPVNVGLGRHDRALEPAELLAPAVPLKHRRPLDDRDRVEAPP